MEKKDIETILKEMYGVTDSIDEHDWELMKESNPNLSDQ